MGNCNQTPCGDLYNPPSRNNMSLFAIIELVIMIVISILSLIELIDCLGKIKKGFGTIQMLVIIDDILIVAAVCYLIYGLFCSLSARNIQIGILLFVIAGVLAMVIIILKLNGSGSGNGNILYQIMQFLILLFLTWILWNQAARV